MDANKVISWKGMTATMMTDRRHNAALTTSTYWASSITEILASRLHLTSLCSIKSFRGAFFPTLAVVNYVVSLHSFSFLGDS